MSSSSAPPSTSSMSLPTARDAVFVATILAFSSSRLFAYLAHETCLPQLLLVVYPLVCSIGALQQQQQQQDTSTKEQQQSCSTSTPSGETSPSFTCSSSSSFSTPLRLKKHSKQRQRLQQESPNHNHQDITVWLDYWTLVSLVQLVLCKKKTTLLLLLGLVLHGCSTTLQLVSFVAQHVRQTAGALVHRMDAWLPRSKYETLVGLTTPFMSLAVAVGWLSQDSVDHAQELLRQARLVWLPALALLLLPSSSWLQGMLVGWTRYVLPYATTSSSSSDHDQRTIMLQYWVLHQLLTAVWTHVIARFVWWMPLFSLASYVMWWYLLLPSTIARWYGLLLEELQYVGIFVADDENAVPQESRVVQLACRILEGLPKHVVSPSPSLRKKTTTSLDLASAAKRLVEQQVGNRTSRDESSDECMAVAATESAASAETQEMNDDDQSFASTAAMVLDYNVNPNEAAMETTTTAKSSCNKMQNDHDDSVVSVELIDHENNGLASRMDAAGKDETKGDSNNRDAATHDSDGSLDREPYQDDSDEDSSSDEDEDDSDDSDYVASEDDADESPRRRLQRLASF